MFLALCDPYIYKVKRKNGQLGGCLILMKLDFILVIILPFEGGVLSFVIVS